MIDKLGVIIPTHVNHEVVIPKCIESCRAFSPKWIVLAQDFSAGHFLSLEVQNLADEIIFQKIGGRSRHWLYQQKAGVFSLKEKGLDYLFSLNGDCVVEKPENFLSFYEKFVDSGADLMCCAYMVNFKGGLTLGTMGLMAKVESFEGILNIMIKDFHDWVKLSSEKRLLYATEKGGYEVLPVENPEHHHFWPERNPNKKGTWMEEIGFAHLHEEWETVWKEKKREQALRKSNV